MTQTTENRFNNHSGPKNYLRGNKSKFTPVQLNDRLRVHALSVATGSPTIKEIVSYWKEKYNIDITIVSETEWRASNRDDIEKKKAELVEDGQLSIPVVSEEILADTMMSMVLSNARTAKKIKFQLDKLLSKLQLDDPGNSKTIDRQNNEIIKLLKPLKDSYVDINSSITDELKHLFMFSGKIKIKDHQIRKLVDERLEQHIDEKEDIDGLLPLQEITDEMRESITKD